MKLTLKEILAATGAPGGASSAEDEIEIEGVSTDTRADVAGRLFVPIKGANFDGHNYIEAALQKGARLALSEREIPGLSASSEKLIKVASTGQALLDLAAYVREKFAGPVAAVTGSAGKTTTKDMIANVMLQKYETLKTSGNFNNHIGLPLTLLSCEARHEAMMLEMGMNHLGEISVLSRVGQPTIAMITNIGDAHIENLGSRENILKAKSEIFEGLREGGTAILNGDDPLLVTIPLIAKAGRTIFCAIQNRDWHIDYVYASRIQNNGLYGTSFSARYHIGEETGEMEITTPLSGNHMVQNALMAVATGLVLGIAPEKIAHGVKTFKPSDNRMEFIEACGMTIINDAYNANPDSMCALVDMLVSSPLKGRRCCIFGDMLELGDFSAELHRKVGHYTVVQGIDLLITIGTEAWHMHDAFCEVNPDAAYHFESKENFLHEWQNYLQAGDTILIKASRAMGLEELAWNIR